MKAPLSISLAVLSIALAAPAAAQKRHNPWVDGGKVEEVTSRLRLGAVDGSTRGGRKLILKRIEAEARRLCEGDGDSPVSITLDRSACRRAAVRDALARLDGRQEPRR